MATILTQVSDIHHEDYINMEITTSSCSNSTLQKQDSNREFEFQMCCSVSNNQVVGGPTTSPADELFYKGKLLPLHLPPRLQMVQKLRDDSNSDGDNSSPSEVSSRRISSSDELDDYFFEWSFELSASAPNSNDDRSKEKRISLTKKIKRKLKSLFNKSVGCSKIVEERGINICVDNHRKSFSGAIQRHCVKKILSNSSSTSSNSRSSSSSFSFGSSSGVGFNDFQSLKRNISANSLEIENSIQGAIAHCKKSQK